MELDFTTRQAPKTSESRLATEITEGKALFETFQEGRDWSILLPEKCWRLEKTKGNLNAAEERHKDVSVGGRNTYILVQHEG